jgi:Protein of unknown function (DUF1236)
MNRVVLMTSVAALAVAMGGVPAGAQMKGDEKGGPPQAQGSPGSSPGGQSQMQQPAQKEPGTAKQGAGKAEPGAKSERGAAQTEPKDKQSKGTAEKTEPKASKGAEKSTEPKSSKGAEKSPEPKSSKGAEKSPEPKSSKGAEKGMAPGDKAPKSAQPGTEPKDKAKTAEPKAGSGERVQLSEQQRTNVGQTLTREKQLNRVTNVNFSINVGTRVPRTVRLVAVPASVIAIVPAYRSYRYFAVEDRICIVDPATYEIVEIITVSGQTADRGGHGHGTLVLTEEERLAILQEVDMSGGSTMALGSLTEGAEVPRGVQVRVFPSTIVQKVPKVKDYKFFTTENRVAIVDPQGSKVQLVIEQRR